MLDTFNIILEMLTMFMICLYFKSNLLKIIYKLNGRYFLLVV